MKDWKPIRIGDITDWFSGGTPSKQTEEFWDGDIPWISARTLKTTRVSSSELKITQLGLENGSRLAIKNDLLILVRGSGLFNFIPISIVVESVAFNQDIKSIRIKDNYKWISPWFLLFWFHSNRRLLNGIMEVTGIGAGKFDTKILQDLIINLPPKDELNIITKTIKAFDDKIDLLQQQNSTLETIAQTIYDNTDYKFTKSIKAEICLCFEKGIEVGSKNYFEEITDSEIFTMFYRVGDISYNGNKAKIFTKKDLLKNKSFSKKDVLVSFDGTVGKVFIGSFGGYSSGIRKIFPKENYGFIDNSFIYFWAKSNKTQRTIKMYSEGTTIQHASKSINYLEINSDREIILKTQEEIKPYFNKILVNLEQIQSLTKTRDTLLPKLMSGQVRVKM